MTKISASLLFCLLLPGAAVFAAQSEIAAGMDKLADTLVGTYQKGHPAATNEKIAIFKFNSSKELEKKHVGFAVSELLTHRIATKSGFTVVERLGLDKILEELKISMSGATDPDDAIKAGKLGGAKLLVLGSVEKIGSKYHVNARLVEVETAEIAATAYESFPIRVFEEEARSYIVYKPEIQRIGIYALANWRHNANNLPRQEFVFTDPWANTTHTTVDPKPFNSLLYGVGVRYSPSAKLTVDISAMSTGAEPVGGNVKEVGQITVLQDDSYPVGITVYRGLISLKTSLSSTFFAHFGAGAASYRLTTGDIPVYNNSPSGFAKVYYVTPCVQLRAEYFIQERVGISLSGNYDFISKPTRQKERGGLVKSKRAELEKLSLEPSISLYF